MDMFDVELPNNLRQPPSPPSTYSSAAAKINPTFGGPIASNVVPQPPTGGSTSVSGPGNNGGNGSATATLSREEPDLFQMLTTPLAKCLCSQVGEEIMPTLIVVGRKLRRNLLMCVFCLFVFFFNFNFLQR
jgi:hypothetical protein